MSLAKRLAARLAGATATPLAGGRTPLRGSSWQNLPSLYAAGRYVTPGNKVIQNGSGHHSGFPKPAKPKAALLLRPLDLVQSTSLRVVRRDERPVISEARVSDPETLAQMRTACNGCPMGAVQHRILCNGDA